MLTPASTIFLLLFVREGLYALPGRAKDDSPPYLELAREIVTKYLTMKQQRASDDKTAETAEEAHTGLERLKSVRTISSSDTILNVHNPMSPRTRERQDDAREIDLHLEELTLRALADENEKLMEELSTLEILKRVKVDPNCDDDTTCDDSMVYRTADGKCNNLAKPLQGSAGIQHVRLLPNNYTDGIWRERMWSVQREKPKRKQRLPSARAVSNAVHKYWGEETGEATPVSSTVSQMLWAFGQFLAHDVIRTPEGDIGKADCCKQSGTKKSRFCMPIDVEAGDPHFPDGACLPAVRSATVLPCNDIFQNQLNDITAYVDASNVYGSSDQETAALRSGTGGYLKESTRQFPPNDTRDNDDVICDRQETRFCATAGDFRANVDPPLTSLHTLFLREHNRIAYQLGKINPHWSDEDIFQETRKILMAEMQQITYHEFLPTLLSNETMTKYRLTTPIAAYSYEKNTDASVFQAFSLAFRGHSMIPPFLTLFNMDYEVDDENRDVIPFTETFLHPHYLFWKNYGGIDEIARGIVGTICPMGDRFVESTARNELFRKGDLAARNVKRGREWGTPPYTKYRALCGLADRVTKWTWNDLTDHTPDALAAVQSVYAHPEDIDLFTGCVTEANLDESMVGPTASCLIGMQFERIKYGDRFWFETTEASSEGIKLGFESDQLDQIRKVTLSRILCDNLDIDYIQKSAFKYGGDLVKCDGLPSMDLNWWTHIGQTRK